MYLSRIRLKDDVRGEKLVAFLQSNAAQDLYATHKLVWKFFSPDEKLRTFIYRAEKNPRGPGDVFTIVSDQRPAPREASDHAFWQIDHKEYEPAISVGDRLEFQLKINPTVSFAGKRQDVLLSKRREQPIAQKAAWYQENLHEEGLKWIERRAERAGFKLVARPCDKEDDLSIEEPAKCKDLRIDAHEQESAIKTKDGRTITVSTMDMAGTLEVIDPDKFKRMLFGGLGHAKAFGCGLMLVRRARA